MKQLLFIFLTICIYNTALYSQKPVVTVPQKTVLLETKYYSFQSNPQLNAHLYLYNRAMGCKFKKVHEDSLAYYSFKDKLKLVKPADLKTLNAVLMYYRDSLTAKDLLLDSLMRDFTDRLSQGTTPTLAWQLRTLDQIKIFQPYFNKLYWKELDAENKKWILATKDQLVKQETAVVPELERIYQTQLPQSKKITVDLTCYATWAGAYTYHDLMPHIIFAASRGSNKGELATEVVFHETSHFLVDKVEGKIKVLAKGKDIRKTINLWHNMIFYTTGNVMDKQWAKEGKLIFPYYVQMKFEEKFPDFKATVEACKEYWDPYISGQSDLDAALKAIVKYIQEKK
ncbi:hypothetical protein CNR22_13345 [Sphingobacteriaceae bacterium]|nr:hypothetical protein CNR22_13345 [Sphingobacteriaceae bacterium]